MSNLICGSSPAESLVVHQLGYAGRLSAHSTAGLLWPQLNGPEFGILSVKHHQLLPTGSCRPQLVKEKAFGERASTARRDSGVRPTTQSGVGRDCCAMSNVSAGYYNAPTGRHAIIQCTAINKFTIVLRWLENEKSADFFHLLCFCVMLFLRVVFFFFLLIRQAQNLPLILNMAPLRGPWAIPL